MTITHQGAGTVLYFSSEELAPVCLSPASPTREEILPLLQTALFQAQRPVPLPMEIQAFPTRDGTLFLVRPGYTGDCRNRFVGFS